MTQRQNDRPRGGRHNAAQPRPPEADARRDDERGIQQPGAPIPAERGLLEGGFDPGLTDLGDDVARGAEDGGSPAAPARGRLEGGIDAGLTDLGADADRPVVIDDDER